MTFASAAGRVVVALAIAVALLASAPGPADAQLVSVADIPLGRYELLARFRLATFPVLVRGSEGQKVVFLHTSMWGGRIEEHGNGPINRVNGFIVAAGGIRNVRGVTTPRGSGYSYQSAVSPSVPGRFGHWSLDLSDDAWEFEAQTYWNRFIGFHLDLWGLRGFHIPYLPSERDRDGKGETFAASHGASVIDRKSAIDIGIDLRLPLALARGRAGYVSLEASLPIVYTLVGFMMAIDEQYASTIYLFGFPHVSAHYRHAVGPAAVHAYAKVPARLAIVPWYLDATEVGFEAGLRF